MNSKDLGATRALAWPCAEIGIMGSRAAVEIIHRRELAGSAEPEREASRLARRYAESQLSAQAAVQLGALDAVIDPAETRDLVGDALFGPTQRSAAHRNGARARA